MKIKFLLLGLPFLFSFGSSPSSSSAKIDSDDIAKIFDTELTMGGSYENLRALTHDVGGRCSGSPQAQKAVEWGYDVLKRLAPDTVFLQECMVPHWVRGEKESLFYTEGKEVNYLPVCALGFSVATPKEGIKAEVIEVHGIDELKALGEAKIKGKIVFFNRPMEPTLIDAFESYGKCVDQRVDGASAGAPYGAVAILVRSMNLRQDDLPHTGVQIYKDGVNKIPAAAISTNAANQLSRMLVAKPHLNLTLVMPGCKTFPDEKSYNVVADIRGSEHPEQIILVGGHLDSWDMAQGAHDDGAGVVHSIEVINLFRKLGWQPKHTIRCVLFMNEENGSRGAEKYAQLSKESHWQHLAAIESDRGGFSPIGFSIDGDSTNLQSNVKALKKMGTYLKPYNLHYFEAGEGGADVDELKPQGTVVIGFMPDPQRYFDHHHAVNDTFEAVNERELKLGAASITALVYMLDQNNGFGAK